MKTCENCGKTTKSVKKLYIELINRDLMFCTVCKNSYIRDSKLLKKLNK